MHAPNDCKSSPTETMRNAVLKSTYLLHCDGATRLVAWASSAAICCVQYTNMNLEKFPPECNRQNSRD
jgi:hypothetical protein